jgi:tetratricopeptide (TPR) repeat protein
MNPPGWLHHAACAVGNKRYSIKLCWALTFLNSAPYLFCQQSGQVQIDRYSRQAERAMASKNWAEATVALESLARLTPDVPEVQGNLGLVYYSQNKLAEAARAFERALKLNPQMARARLMLGLCYAELGRNQEAVSILAPAFRHPPDPEIGRLMGMDLQRSYAALQEFDKAFAVNDELLKRYPNDPEILFQASRLYADRAYETMTKLIEMAPNSIWVRYAMAEVHESQQHYDLAAKEYRTVIKMGPRLPDVHFRLGRVLLMSSKEPRVIDEAMQEFERELEVAPQNANAEYELGEVFRERGQFERALEHFTRAVQFRTGFSEAQIGLSRTLLSMGKPREALPHLMRAVQLNSQDAVPHFLLASAYKVLGDKDNSQKELILFQKLRTVRTQSDLHVPGAAPGSEVTRQTLGSDTSP